jgi:hypothetical protein
MGISFVLARSGKGIDVCLEGELIVGHITADGIFDIVFEYFSLEPEELRRIARKVEEVREFSHKIPVCPTCGGTPYFPGVLPEAGKRRPQMCTSSLHSSQRPR